VTVDELDITVRPGACSAALGLGTSAAPDRPRTATATFLAGLVRHPDPTEGAS
jgi:hypothetical protein